MGTPLAALLNAMRLAAIAVLIACACGRTSADTDVGPFARAWSWSWPGASVADVVAVPDGRVVVAGALWRQPFRQFTATPHAWMVDLDEDGAFGPPSIDDPWTAWNALVVDDGGQMYAVHGGRDDPSRLLRLDDQGAAASFVEAPQWVWDLHWVEPVLVGVGRTEVGAWTPELSDASVPAFLVDPPPSKLAARPGIVAWGHQRHDGPNGEVRSRVFVRGQGQTTEVALPDDGDGSYLSAISVGDERGHALLMGDWRLLEQTIIGFDAWGRSHEVAFEPTRLYVEAIATAADGTLVVAGKRTQDVHGRGWVHVYAADGTLGWTAEIAGLAVDLPPHTDAPAFGVNPRKIAFTDDGGFVVAGEQDSALAFLRKYVLRDPPP